MPYHRRYHDDALVGFSGLNMEQRGAYQLLLDLMYSVGGEIDDNDAYHAGQLLTTTKKWRRVKAELVALGKIWIVNGKIGNGRAMAEIEAQERAYRKMVEGGEEGARRRAAEAASGTANADVTQVQPHIHREYKPDITQVHSRFSEQKANKNNIPHQGYPPRTLDPRVPATRTNNQILNPETSQSPPTAGHPAGGPPPAASMGGGGLAGAKTRKPPPAAQARTPAEQLDALRQAAEAEAEQAPGAPLAKPTPAQRAAAQAAQAALLAETLAARSRGPPAAQKPQTDPKPQASQADDPKPAPH